MTTEARWPIPGRAAVTFHPRNGRMNSQRVAVLDEVLPRFAVSPTQWADVAVAFGRVAPVVLEIGFGQGEATAAYALSHPDHDLLGAEVHVPGVAALAQRCDELGLANVRIIWGDALALLHDVVPSGALDAVHVFFPDPWPKRRQQHRRLVQPDVAALVANRLRVGGVLRCATDDAGYAEQMDQVLRAQNMLAKCPSERPDWRPVTRFEGRAVRADRTIAEFCYART